MTLSRLERTRFRVHGLTDGRFLIGSLDRMLTMASTAE